MIWREYILNDMGFFCGLMFLFRKYEYLSRGIIGKSKWVSIYELLGIVFGIL